MSQDQSGRRVIAVAPMPPEKSAYALARYSRSPDSIEQSIRWVHGAFRLKSSGISSILTMGMRPSPISAMSSSVSRDIRTGRHPAGRRAAVGRQAKSSRYQNFASSRWFVPGQIRGSETEALYEGILRSLSEVYRLLQDPLTAFLSEHDPRPESMKAADTSERLPPAPSM